MAQQQAMRDLNSPFMRGSRQFPMGHGLKGASAAFATRAQQFTPELNAADPLLQKMQGSTMGDVTDLRQSVQSLTLTAKRPEMAAGIRNTIIRLPMLADVNEEQISRMIAAMEFVRLQPREVLIRAGDTQNDYMYVVQSGRMQLMSPSGDGMYLLQGDSFGTEALTVSGLAAEYTAVAQGNTDLWRLHRRAFKLLQMDYGARLRMIVQSVIDQNRATKQKHLSAMQTIVKRALDGKREREALNQSLVWQEFADVKAVINDFTKVGIIGSGAFGEVQLCIHTPTRKAYALKIQKNANQPRLEANIEREVACMREAGSPFLMRFFGEHKDPRGHGEHYMILEYLGGGSLEDAMGGRANMQPMTLEKGRFYFACMLAAFDALHTAGWMHRDLSAKNVMVDNHGYGKLIDVGLAKQVKHTEMTYTMCGTPIYYAPELIKSTGYSHKAEIWALGVLLYELLAAKPPFMPPATSKAQGNARRLELYDTIVKGEPDYTAPSFGGATGHAAKDALQRMLKKRPAERAGIPEIRTSAFYEGFDWDAFHAYKMPPPFKPKRDERVPEPR